MFFRTVLLLILSLFPMVTALAAPMNDAIDYNLRDTALGISTTVNSNGVVETFRGPLADFFFSPWAAGSTAIIGTFVQIAFQIKNFFIVIAVIFLIIGVMRLLFSNGTDEDILAWRRNIIWTSIGIFVMQIAFSVWNTLLLTQASSLVDATLGWAFWKNVLAPIVGMMQIFAGFGFLMMMLYAFYMIVTGGGDDEKLKKGKSIVIYAVIGFFLIRLPQTFIGYIYGTPDCSGDAVTCTTMSLTGSVTLIGKVFLFFNTFLTLFCVVMVLYAGYLVLMSGGDEERLKKARRIILYIVIGFLILVASNAIFRFFIMQG